MKRDIFGELGEVLREMGGPGSGHHGHAGVKGQRGGSAPSSGGALVGTAGIQNMSFSRHVIGGGKGKSRKRVMVKSTSGPFDVLAVSDLEDEKYLLTEDEMKEYLEKSALLGRTEGLGSIRFVPTHADIHGKKWAARTPTITSL